ncbi:MAG TPA: GNAT family N-acetyltransferase [Streptosporangiaceae bacterium]|nr:GNAT family N-acetyltransferase [Streptosporangiaceae bacterium]
MSAAAENENTPAETVADNAAMDRYEIKTDGQVLGFAAYRTRPDGAVVFTHTEIDGAHEGQGLGSRLARGALEDIQAAGGSVVPRCPFIKGYIDRHPEFQGLIR